MAPKKNIPFTDFRKIAEGKTVVTESLLQTDPLAKQAVKEFLMKKKGISDNGLVSLVVLFNTGAVNETTSEELTILGYLKDGKITDVGNKLLDDENILARLKAML